MDSENFAESKNWRTISLMMQDWSNKYKYKIFNAPKLKTIVYFFKIDNGLEFTFYL